MKTRFALLSFVTASVLVLGAVTDSYALDINTSNYRAGVIGGLQLPNNGTALSGQIGWAPETKLN